MRFASPSTFFQTVSFITLILKVEIKSWFDKYGEYGLKEGVPGPTGTIIGGYRYPGNSFEIFDRVFGTTNPFAEKPEDDGRDQYGSLLGDAYGGKSQPMLPSPADIHVTLECTLYELYNGCLKKVTYHRQVLLHDGKTTKERTEDVNVEVKPGYSEQTLLTFAGKGNEAEGHRASNLVVNIIQSANEGFRRKGNDLIYTHKITLEEALLSQPVKVKALDGRTIITTVDEIITPQTVKVIEGEGMPIS
jgi:DnaJ-class molecular chaperone